MTRRGDPGRRALILAFVSLGAASSTVPAAIPGSAERLGVPAAQLLPAVSLLFAGLLAGVLLAAIPRSAQRTVLTVGLALEAVGLLLVALSATPGMFLAAAAVTGLGFGSTEASATALARTLAASGTSARLAALNGAAAVAAAGAPLLIAVAPARLHWLPLVALAVLPAAGAVITASLRIGRSAVGGDPSGPGPESRAHLGGLVVIAAALFVFVGAETVLAGWSSVLAQSVLDLPADAAAGGTAVFWALMAVGRFACARIVRHGVPPTTYLVGSLGLAVVLTVSAAVLPSSAASAALLAGSVLLVAPGYALLLGSALERIPSTLAGRATAWLVAIGSAGGSAVSFVVAASAGSAPTPVLLWAGGLLAACAVLVAVFRWARR